VRTDHWWWRPGWRIGRSRYTWHVTFAASPNIQNLASTFRPTLASLPTYDPVTAAELHITVQGLGFTDEVDPDDVQKIVEAAQTLCATAEPMQLELGPVDVDAEALGLPVGPWATPTASFRSPTSAPCSRPGTSTR